MILLSSPLKNDPLETMVRIFFFLEIEIFTTKIINSKSLKKICRQLLSTMNILKLMFYKTLRYRLATALKVRGVNSEVVNSACSTTFPGMLLLLNLW